LGGFNKRSKRMDFQINPNDRPKYVAISILTGIGKGIGAFLLTGIIYFILFLLSLLIWFETIPMMILGLAPFVALAGGLVAILVGIRSGENKYKDLLKSRIQEPDNVGGLAEFARKLDDQELNKSAEEYYNNGKIVVVNSQFDDAILEFSKVIRITTNQEKWYLLAQTELKSMGFSEDDIKQVQLS